MKIVIDKNIKTPKQYSKVWMTRHQCLAWFWISVYLGVDIYFNKGENVNNIVVLLISSIIATIIPYFCKSYFETKAEKANELALQNNNELNNIEQSYTENIDEQNIGG